VAIYPINMLFIHFIVAISVLAFVVAANEGGAKVEHPLKMMETFIQQFSKDKDFKLGSEFRDAQGELLNVDVKDVSPDSVHSSAGVSEVPTSCVSPTASDSFSTDILGVSTPITYAYTLTASVTTASATVCTSLTGNLPAVGVNYATPTGGTAATGGAAVQSNIDFGSGSGSITFGGKCNNCYGYIGGAFNYVLSCTMGTTNVCNLYYSIGGQTGLNLDVSITDPKIASTGTTPTVLPLSLTNAQAVTLIPANSNNFGFFLTVLPTVNAIVGGALEAKGTLGLKAGFSTSAKYSISAASTITSGQYTQGFDASITVGPATISNSNWQLLSSSAFMFGIQPTIQWQFGFTYSVAGIGYTIKASVNTPIAATYTYTDTVTTTMLRADSDRRLDTCTSSQALYVNGYFQGVSATASGGGLSIGGDISFPAGVAGAGTSVSVVNSGSQCLNAALNPTMVPTAAPTNSKPPTSSSSSSSSSNNVPGTNLPPGELAAAIIVPIVVFFIAAGVAAYLYQKRVAKK